MSNNLINRDDALAIIKYSKDPADGIQNLPTVDAVEVKHGRWINEVELRPELYGWVPLNSVVCSICKNSNELEKPYCPNCGARMDGE